MFRNKILKHFQPVIFAVIIIISPTLLYSQTARVIGTVRDIYDIAIQGANVVVTGLNIGTVTNGQGYFELVVPANKKLLIRFTYFGNTKDVEVKALSEGEKYKLNININSNVILNPYEVKGRKENDNELMQKVDSRALDVLPAATEKVYALVKTLPGVSSNSELTSAYSVRGGNYDENLIYINDVEIYRPFLVRSGQEEGLSVINSDLVDDIQFSAGGFEAKYGDKMSSVLDIKYKEPTDFHGNFSASLLGFSGHVEGSSKDGKFTYLIGARQHSNTYLLNTLDVKGDYTSSFTDFQSYFTYTFNKKTSIDFLSYYGNNLYKLIPQTQETNYGTMNLVLNLTVYFDGQEITTSQDFLNAFTFNYKPRDSFDLKVIFSAYNTTEKEYFDIMGQYWLSQIDIQQGSPTFGKAINSLGVGTYLNHARDELNAYIYNVQHIGTRTFKKSELKWGVKVQFEEIRDKMREWQLQDSADYSIPITNNQLDLNNFINSNVNLNSFRYSGYVQNTFTLSDSNSMFLTTGVRASYWDYNNEFFATPRAEFYFMPNRRHNLYIIHNKLPDSLLKKNISFKAAAGMYYQPAFFKELMNQEGEINPDIRAQKSIQVDIGSDVTFKMWERRFKFSTEIYYKYLYDLIPYDIEDVRILYYGKNEATGYSTGIDMQLYGEFISNLPSWISLSLMKTMEDVDGRGYIPRPTDQRFRVSVFFQDLLPNNPTSKVHLNLVFASPLPFGPPQDSLLRDAFRMRGYKRVDVGFSKLLFSAERYHKKKLKYLNKLSSIWLSAEIFNLFDNQNTISYFWVKDVNNNLWGVPNYLTGRRLNLSMIVKF